MELVNDYEASGKMKTNVTFIKSPLANVKVFFKKPNRLRIKNENGISFIPKGAVHINFTNIFNSADQFEIIDAGREETSGLRILKLMPRDESDDIVLSTLYIDDKKLLVMKAKTTTQNNGTYELVMKYGNYADYGLADKVIFTFNTKDYKLPRGITFDYDDGSKKNDNRKTPASAKGSIEISYTSYIINKGVPNSVFQNK